MTRQKKVYIVTTKYGIRSTIASKREVMDIGRGELSDGNPVSIEVRNQ